MNTYRIKESKKDSRLRFAVIFDSNGKRKEKIMIGQGRVLRELGVISYSKEWDDELKNNWFAIYADGICSMDFRTYSELIDFVDEYAQTIAD